MDADVVIAGAGTAGCAAAAVLAPVARVVLVDPVAVPRWRIGETLPGAATRLLRRIGALEAFQVAGHAPAPVRVSRWGSDHSETLDSMRDPDGVGWRLDRARFEQDLRSAAQARGAHLCTGAALSVEGWRDGGWQLRLCDGTQLRARLLLDASGRASRLVRNYGQRRLVADRLACAWYVSDHADRDGDPSIVTHAAEEGWWYSARIGSGQRLIAFHSDADLPALKAVLRRGVLASAREVTGFAAEIGDLPADDAGHQGVSSAASLARSAAGPGWLALGDACLAFDPLSSQGLFNELATGVEAGEAAASLLAGSDQAAVLAAYAGRIGRIWQAYKGHLALVYGLERRWPESPFWQRRQRTAAVPVSPAPRARGSGATVGAPELSRPMAATSPT